MDRPDPDQDKGCVYFDQKRSLDLLSYFNRQRLHGNLTDYTVKVRGQRFPAHKSVLASASDYFSSLFEFGGKDTGEVTLDHINPDDLSTVLDFVYTGVVKLTIKNVQGVLVVANYLQVRFLIQESQSFMEKHLDGDNVFEALKFSYDFSLLSLKKKCFILIQKNLETVSQCKNFLQSNPMLIRDVLDDEKLVVGNLLAPEAEAVVLRSVLTYLSQESISDDVIDMLLSTIRLPDIPQNDVKQIVSHFPRLKESKQLTRIMALSARFQKMKTSKQAKKKEESFPDSWRKPRKKSHYRIIERSHRYGVPFMSSIPCPSGCPESDREIASISIWVVPPGPNSPAAVGGLVVRYRADDINQDDRAYCRGTFRAEWEHFLLELGPEEFIIEVQIHSTESIISSIGFKMTSGRSFGPYGGRQGVGNVEYAPTAKKSFLNAILCDYVDTPPVTGITNLSLRWIIY